MAPRRTYALLALLAIASLACNRQAAPTAAPFATATATAPPTPTSIWDDRAVFRAGLIPEEQKALSQLPGASVYHLDVQIADDLASLTGQQRVRYTNQEQQALDAVYFQLFANMWGGECSVSALQVDGQDVQPLYEDGRSTLRVPLSAPLQPGQRAEIEMDFQVEVPTELAGNYGLFGYLDGILVLDGFYPAIPAYDAQGWHAGRVPPSADTTFQDASFYLVRVTAPASVTLIASGIQVERTWEGDLQAVTFAAGPARDFYLAASERLVRSSETAGATTVNSYAFEERSEASRSALRTAMRAIQSFSARFGAYPYSEFDVVSTPMQGALGIEYPGIVGINYTAYDPTATLSGLPAPVILESTLAHEVAHQWFYNVVGNDQHNQPWLDEAVVQYVTGLYFLDAYGPQGLEGFRDSWLVRWERVGRAAIPVGLPAGDYQGKEYGAIVYGRGPLFIEALAQKMGQAAFDAFLREYYQAHQWGIATAASFQQLAQEHCGCDLQPLFDEWVNPR